MTEDESIESLFIVAFRGSGKSTIITTSYPLWAILGKQRKKYVLIFSQTQVQARQHMANIRQELENNKELRDDLGPFQENQTEWGSTALVFSNMNARIAVASVEQKVRGLRHRETRPDLIICDDVENDISTKTREGRDKTYKWLKGEVIPTGDLKTRLIVVGNLLHEDSLLVRLEKDIANDKLDGTFRSYPLTNEQGHSIWPGKYPTKADLIKEQRKIGDDVTWQREYLLKIIADEGQIIRSEWIQYYEDSELPTARDTQAVISIDPATSTSATADFTAIVSALVAGYKNTFTIYILPHPTNKRLEFPDLIENITAQFHSLKIMHPQTQILVEDVGFQKSIIQQLDRDGIKAKGVHVVKDKRDRLMAVSNLIKTGTVKFPRTGAEHLIEQLVGFGKENHDDLADAFSMLIQSAIEMDKPKARGFSKNSAAYRSLQRHGF